MHAIYGVPSAGMGETMPPKITAAFQFLDFAYRVTEGQQSPFGGDVPKDTGRKLSNMEAAVYDSALSTILEYFNEPGFGNSPPKPMTGPDEPEDKKPVPV
jgi:hypothetical protein